MRRVTFSPGFTRLAGFGAASLALACSLSAAEDGGRTSKERARAEGQVELCAGPTKARLSPSSPAKSGPSKPLTEIVRSLGPDRKLYLVVGDLRTDAPPGTLYNLYLDLPDDASAAASERHFVGSINFYNATRSKEPEKSPRSSKFVSLDLTDVAGSLDSIGALSKETIITIMPANEPAKDAYPRIGELTVQEQ